MLRGVSFDGQKDIRPQNSVQSVAIFRSNNIQDATINHSDLIYVRKSRVNQLQLMRSNDILICMANGSKKLVGKSALFKGAKQEFSFGAFMGVFRCFNDTMASFIAYLLQTNQYREYIDVLLSGSSINNLRPSDIENLEFSIPPSSEQLRIANTLKLCDDHISALQSLIAKYGAIKKATVNLLLKPKPGWRRVKLGDVTETSSGGTPSRNEDSYYQGSIPWFTTSELCDESLYDSKEHISQEALQNSSAKIFPKGTLLLAMYGATIGKLGVLTKPAATNQACCAIKCGSDVETAFLFQVLYSRRQEIIALGCGAGQPNISQQIIKNLDLVLPPLPEQRKIAAQIAAIDKVLNDCKKQLDKAKNLKQGMMSYFFG